MPLTAAVLLRSTAPSDQEFLDALYLSTRDDLQALAADPALRPMIAPMIAMQQKAQALSYQASYPGAEYLVIEHAGAPVGRAVVHADADCLRLVDLSVLPQARGQGCAGGTLAQLQRRAAEGERELHLTVRLTNTGARRLYERLGFDVLSDDGLDARMRWRP